MHSGSVMLIALVLVSLAAFANGADDTYLIGTGRYDVTGPAAEIEMVRMYLVRYKRCCNRYIAFVFVHTAHTHTHTHTDGICSSHTDHSWYSLQAVVACLHYS